MMNKFLMISFAAASVFSTSMVFAQAFGEYGRAVGSVPHGKSVTGTRGSGAVSQGKSRGGSVGQAGQVPVQNVPPRLIVAATEAGLYPRQDDESQKLEQLNQGEILTPMVQSVGGSEWFMVKTQKGVIGWVKSMDVRDDRIKK